MSVTGDEIEKGSELYHKDQRQPQGEFEVLRFVEMELLVANALVANQE